MKSAIDDLDNRRPVWAVASEFYLDTELEADDYERIADTLCRSPYSIEELDRIMFEELYPVLIPNCWCVAGEWAGFDLEALEEAILERLSRRIRWPLFLIPGRFVVRDPWDNVKQLVTTNPLS